MLPTNQQATQKETSKGLRDLVYCRDDFFLMRI